MKKATITNILILLFISFSAISCINEEEYSNTPKDNFEALWKIMDEHYCFFSEKEKQFGINWNDIHTKYSSKISKNMNSIQLFDVLSSMLAELKDGHVNLYSSFDTGRNWSWYEDYPSNFNSEIVDNYLKNCRISSGIYYKVLDDNVAYIRYPSFNSGLSEGALSDILYLISTCNGLIIDVRNNGGGLLSNAETFASHFFNKQTLVGYMQHKTGKGHNDFSNMEEQIIKPSSNTRWQKKTIVLTNRKVYSAANEFVKYMQQSELVSVIGDTTGGGAGMPFSSELPNGWLVRFSACPMYDVNKESTEHGIMPDIKVNLKNEDILNGKDTIIEFARKIISQ